MKGGPPKKGGHRQGEKVLCGRRRGWSDSCFLSLSVRGLPWNSGQRPPQNLSSVLGSFQALSLSLLAFVPSSWGQLVGCLSIPSPSSATSGRVFAGGRGGRLTPWKSAGRRQTFTVHPWPEPLMQSDVLMVAPP